MYDEPRYPPLILSDEIKHKLIKIVFIEKIDLMIEKKKSNHNNFKFLIKNTYWRQPEGGTPSPGQPASWCHPWMPPFSWPGSRFNNNSRVGLPPGLVGRSSPAPPFFFETMPRQPIRNYAHSFHSITRQYGYTSICNLSQNNHAISADVRDYMRSAKNYINHTKNQNSFLVNTDLVWRGREAGW